MTVIGEAWINVLAKTEGFDESIRKGAEPGLTGLTSDAEKAGTDAGDLLGGGIGGGVGRGLDDAEKDVEGRGSSIGKKLTGGFSSALSNVGSMLGADFLGPVTTSVDKAGEHMDDTKGKAGGLGSMLQSVGGGIALGAAAGFVAFSAEGVKLGLTMQSTDSKIAAAGDTSQSAAKKIGDAFLNTAGTTTFSGQEMASAYAGVVGQLTATEGHALSAHDALMVMTAATDAAEASGQSLDSVTGALSKTMQSFHLSAGEAGTASDLLYNASKATGMGIDAVATQMGKLHSQLGANAPGLSTMSSLMVDFARNSVTGRAATTAMSGSLQALTNPTDKQSQALQLLGVNLKDSNGKFIGMGPALDALKGKLGENGNALAKQAAAILFSGKTLAQFQPIIEQGSAGWDKNAASVTKAGSAHEAAEKATANLHGSIEKLGAEVKDNATEWGEVLIPILTKVIGVLVKVAGFIIDHKVLLLALAGVIGTVVVAAFVSWAASILMVDGALAPFVIPLLLVAAAVAALIAVVYEVASHWSQIWAEVKRVAEDVWTALTHGFDDLVGFFAKLPSRILSAVEGLGKLLLRWITDAWNAVLHWILTAFDLYLHYWIELPLRILQVILRFGPDILRWITTAWNTLVAWVVGALSAWVAWWAAIPGRVLAGLAVLGDMLLGWITSAWGMVTSGLSTAWSDTLSFVESIPGKVLSALGNAGGMLLQWGKDLITGLINGIKSMAGEVMSGFKALFDDLPGVSLLKKIPGLSWLAEGGLVTTPTLSVIGEAGPELVLPLSKVQSFLGRVQAVPGNVSGSLNSSTGFGPSTSGSTPNTPGTSITQQNIVQVTADVTDDTIAKIEAMFARNNRDLARHLGGL